MNCTLDNIEIIEERKRDKIEFEKIIITHIINNS